MTASANERTNQMHVLVGKLGDARVARALHNSEENTARIDVAVSAVYDFFLAERAAVRAEVAAEILTMDDGYEWEKDMLQRVANLILEPKP